MLDSDDDTLVKLVSFNAKRAEILGLINGSATSVIFAGSVS